MADTRKRRSSGQQLSEQATDLLGALAERAMSGLEGKASGLTERLSDYAEHGGPGLGAAIKGIAAKADGSSALKGAVSGGASGLKHKIGQTISSATGKLGKGGGGGANQKVTNIVEEIDVGVPRRVAYNQWTQFQDFPDFTKKVETAEQREDVKLHWQARIAWSHRSWESTIVEQVPDERIVWRSQGEKGHVDGAVTFHSLDTNLTRVLLVLEYHPKGFVEHVGNLWRAQGRRARLELKHFQRHVMTRTIIDSDEVEGWRGEIRDGEVVRGHQEAVEAEDDYPEDDEAEDDEAEDDEAEDDEAEDDEAEDDEAEDDEADEEDEEYDDDDEGYEDDAEDDDIADESPPPRRRTRSGKGSR